MKYPEQYRTELVNAIQGIDLEGVSGAIEVFRDARAHGRCIFVCGGPGNAATAAQRLCEMVKQSSLGRSMRFHIMPVVEETSRPRVAAGDPDADTVFLDQLRNTAQYGDVVIGISTSGNSRPLVRAFEYANRIGCRTIAIAGRDGGKLAKISNIVVLVPASHAGSVEDAHMIICHMIGYYFANFDQG
jgi:D-sedoheptulose 7-phosphate isomerase